MITVLLWHSYAAGARVHMSGVAFEPHGSTVEGAGGNTAQGDENNIRGQ